MEKSSNNKDSAPILMRVPVIGAYIEIASDYAAEGAIEYFEKIAPAKCWARTLVLPIIVSALLAAVPYPCGCLPGAIAINAAAHDVALTLIPSLLGFGIGAYALVFGLNGELLKRIQAGHEARAQKTGAPAGSVLNINSAFAFPLATMALTLLIAIVNKILPNIQVLSSGTWFLVFFCMTLTYQLVISLYKLGRVIILDKF